MLSAKRPNNQNKIRKMSVGPQASFFSKTRVSISQNAGPLRNNTWPVDHTVTRRSIVR